MADGGGEDFGFVRAVFVGPSDDAGGFGGFGVRRECFAFFGLGRDDLHARSDGFACEDLDVVVKLFVDRRPVFEALGDGVCFVGEGDGNGLFWAVRRGLQPEHFIPSGIVGTGGDGFAEIAGAVAVHGTVKVHGGFTGLVCSEDGTDVGGIGDVSAALVVDDDVEVFVPILGLVDLKGGLGALVGIVGDIDNSIEACLDSFFENDALLVVFMAAATSDDKDAQGFDGGVGGLGKEQGSGEGESREWEDELHGMTNGWMQRMIAARNKRDVEQENCAGNFDRENICGDGCCVGEFLSFDDLMHWSAVSGRFTPPARLAVIGDPIAHSRSPQMHNPALRACGIDAQYIRVQVPVGRVGEAFQQFVKCGFLGVNITIPHKFEALAVVDELDELAAALGAVNTLAIRDGKLHGYNSDGPGFIRSVREAFGAELQDLRVLILGAGGGAGRAVAAQSALKRCRKLILVNRSIEKAETVAGEIRAVGRCPDVSVLNWTDEDVAKAASNVDLIVNATSLGMKASDAKLLPAGVLEARHLVFDMVYRADGSTPLLADAKLAGAKTVDGLTLLLHQGAISFEHWFDQPAPLDVMRAGLQNAVMV